MLFQSTLPRGERHCAISYKIDDRKISIHAPAWGATGGGKGAPQRARHFNPRSRVGSDGGESTGGVLAVDFNPRSRVGSDKGVLWRYMEAV